MSGSSTITRGRFTSVQVNVDAFGNNIPGDAANEPSIAVDPNHPDIMVIGWRQFDSVDSDFRQAGYAYSHDGGITWTFPGSLTPGVFGSDPVLDANRAGGIFYVSINFDEMRVFTSLDGGVTWPGRTSAGIGLLDKPWMAVDRTGGMGDGHIYISATNVAGVIRSVDGGTTFVGNSFAPRDIAMWGTLAVDRTGALLAVDWGFNVSKSLDAQDATREPTWRVMGNGFLVGGAVPFFGGPNPDGLQGQAWIATDHQAGPCRGRVYVFGSVAFGGSDPLDVRFARSLDGGISWDPWKRINDDPFDNGAYQWFGTMSVAPNGRIDVVWNDTRNTGQSNLSELHYSFSYDAGETWSPNIPAGPVWDSWIGWPRQNKIGDYYDMVSDNNSAMLAYAATYNGEQDVYFLRLTPDCDSDGIADIDEIMAGTAEDCSGNGIPDACERDCDGNGVADTCDIILGHLPDLNANDVPDECEPDFDGDTLPDGCDMDIDNDGVLDVDDICLFTPADAPVRADGSMLLDSNADCAVDLLDFGRWQRCLLVSGPGIDAGLCADFFDTNGDRDVDLEDFSAFQRVFTGTLP